MPKTIQLLGQALNGERQQANSGNSLRPLSYWGRPSVVRKRASKPQTTPLSGQALSGEKESKKASDHSAIRADPQW